MQTYTLDCAGFKVTAVPQDLAHLQRMPVDSLGQLVVAPSPSHFSSSSSVALIIPPYLFEILDLSYCLLYMACLRLATTRPAEKTLSHIEHQSRVLASDEVPISQASRGQSKLDTLCTQETDLHSGGSVRIARPSSRSCSVH
jgi:hypothetical protein